MISYSLPSDDAGDKVRDWASRQRDINSPLSSAMDRCPFVVSTPGASEAALEAMAGAALPQKVHAAFVVGRNSTAALEEQAYLKTNVNSLVLRPEGGSFAALKPRVHPAFTFDAVAIWDGESLRTTADLTAGTTAPLTAEALFDADRMDLHGSALRVSAVEYAPFYYEEEEEEEEGGEGRGIEADLVRAVAKAMGGTADIR